MDLTWTDIYSIYSLSIHLGTRMRHNHAIHDRLLGLLAASPKGLRAPELLALFPVPISQPSLSRRLQELRARGLVAIEGKARATRYHALLPGQLPMLRSRRLHQAVALRLTQHPELRAQARTRLSQLRQVNPHGRLYHDRWAELLAGPLPRLLRKLTEDSEDADTLRKESPFTVLVDRNTRRRIFEQVSG